MNVFSRAAALLCCVGALVHGDCTVEFSDGFFTLNHTGVPSGLNYIMKTDGDTSISYKSNFVADEIKQTLQAPGAPEIFRFSDIVATDYATFVLVRICNGDVETAHLLATGRRFTRTMNSSITIASWEGEWTASFNKAVEDLKPLDGAQDRNTCMNLKPMKGMKTRQFDGRWITAKHSGKSAVFGQLHVPRCAALSARHTADDSNVTVTLHKGTGMEVRNSMTSQTLQPGKFFGQNVFQPDWPMTAVDTVVYTDYTRWALLHQCTTGDDVEDEFALVLYKPGKITKEQLQGTIESLVADNKRVWPAKFVQLVEATVWVADTLCPDRALDYCTAQFDEEQLGTAEKQYP